MRNLVTVPNFSGVAAGQTATMTLPAGGNFTYHKLILEFGCTNTGGGNQANTESFITQVRLKVNGKIQRAFSAKQLDSINGFYNRAFQSRNSLGYLEVFLSEPWRRTPRGEDSLEWGTGDASTFTVEADIASGATGPTLNPLAVVEYVQQPMGMISKWYLNQQPVTATGLIVNNTLPKSANNAYQALHCFPVNATDITSVVVKTDQTIRFQGSYYDMQSVLQSEGWTPQASMFHIVFDMTGRVTDALPMQYLSSNGKPSGVLVGNFEIDFTMNAANGFQFISQVLGPRD